jgi:hypothetical protein
MVHQLFSLVCVTANTGLCRVWFSYGTLMRNPNLLWEDESLVACGSAFGEAGRGTEGNEAVIHTIGVQMGLAVR